MKKKDKLLIGIVFGMILLIYLLNFSIFSNKPYQIGADINYHLGLTNLVSEGAYSTNPYFLEEKNIYPVGAHFTIFFLSSFLNASPNTLWGLYVPIISALFLLFFFLFVRNLWGNFVAIFSTILMFCWNQILWPDPTSRLFAWFILIVSLFVFSIYLKTKDKRALILSLGFALFLIWIHTEIFIHLLIIYLVYFILKKFKILEKTRFTFSYKFNNRAILLLLLLGFILFHLILKELINFQGVASGLIYNEIPLSIFYPFGVISLLILILAIPSILNCFKKSDEKNLLLISIIFLISNSIFYFTYLWGIHHRYFSETGFLGVIILAATYLKKVFQNENKHIKSVFIILLFLFLMLSIYSRYEFITYIEKQTGDNFEVYLPILSWIKENTLPNSTIAIHPDNILNRYIPGYSNRFILGAVGTINPERQWSIISTGCTVIGKENICESRENMTRQLFENFSIERLKEIKKSYKLDYILINKNSPIKEIIEKEKEYTNKTESQEYILYKLN